MTQTTTIPAPRTPVDAAAEVETSCGHKVPEVDTQQCVADPWDVPHCIDCHDAHALACGACNTADTESYDG